MAPPTCNGPVLATVVVVEGAADEVVVVEVWRGEVGVGEPEPQAANTRGAATAAAVRSDPNPNCSR
jgi:hypothetical protein